MQSGPGGFWSAVTTGDAVAALRTTVLLSFVFAVTWFTSTAMAAHLPRLLQALGRRVRTLTRTVRNLASASVYGRLVGLFETLAVDIDGQRVVPGPLSQQRIAERVGASKAMVNRLLQDLERGGYAQVTRDRIVLLKRLPSRW